MPSKKPGHGKCGALSTVVGILPHFWFCSEQMRLIKAFTLTIQIDAIAFVSPVLSSPSSPQFFARYVFCHSHFIYDILGHALIYFGLYTLPDRLIYIHS